MIPKRQLEVIRRLNSKKNGELKKLKVPPKWLFPHSAERKYTAELYRLTFQIRKAIQDILMPAVPSLLEVATYDYPDPVKVDGIRSDDYIDVLNDLLIAVTAALDPYVAIASANARKIGLEIAIFNNAQFEKITNSVLGIDIFLEQPWLQDQLELFSNQNAQLIESLTETEINRASGIIQRAFQEGSSYASIEKDIQKSFGITRRHARLIARDQTTKLNGSLTKLRQQELGIQFFIWQTSGDERVRDSHRVMDGKTCRWDNPNVWLDEKSGKWVNRSSTATKTFTSQDVNCRCVPIPVIETLFD